MKRDQANKYPVEKKTSQENGKKKIIPVVSDSSESSPSPDEPSTPLDSPQPSSISSRFRMSQRSLQGNNDMASLGQKLKNSYSKYRVPSTAATGQLLVSNGFLILFMQALGKDPIANSAEEVQSSLYVAKGHHMVSLS